MEGIVPCKYNNLKIRKMVEESVPSSTFLQTESRRNSSSSAENEEM